MTLKVGILAIQGNVEEHALHMKQAMESLGINGEVKLVRRPDQMQDISGIIIPGGESTTMSKLMRSFGVLDFLRKKAAEGFPIFGTCAGTIMLAKDVVDIGKHDVTPLGVMNMKVARNAYGRQKESFEDTVTFDGREIPGVFIRAPGILEVMGNCHVLAKHGEAIIAAEEGNLMAATFHPELTDDLTVHKKFAEIVAKSTT